MTSVARIVYPSLPNDVETWEIIEIKQVPKQTDGYVHAECMGVDNLPVPSY